jgi:hypothetical protein
MEAKDTVMSRKQKHEFIIARSHLQTTGELQEDYLIKEQAVISFQSGFNEAMNKRLSSRQLYQMAHQAGIKEVVDWIENNRSSYSAYPRNGYFYVQFSLDNWQSFLKEKGIA